jgi:hypothetical protein
MGQDAEQMMEVAVGHSLQHFAALGEALKGAGGDAQAHFRSMVQLASTQPGAGQHAAAEFVRLRGDESLPADHRVNLAMEKRQAGEAILKKFEAGAHDAAIKLDETLQDGVLPKPGNDVGQRTLVRQEIQATLGGKTGTQLLEGVQGMLGRNSRHDAELLGDFGRALLDGHGLGKHVEGIKAAAVGAYIKRSDGTERQMASRRALQLMESGKTLGHLAGLHAIGLTRLKKWDR